MLALVQHLKVVNSDIGKQVAFLKGVQQWQHTYLLYCRFPLIVEQEKD